MNDTSILFFVEAFPPENLTGGAIHVYETTKRLARNTNNNIFILTSTKDKRCKQLEVTENNIQIKRIYVPPFSKFQFLRRLAFITLSIPVMIRMIKKYDINIVTVNVNILAAIPAFICSKLTRTKVVAVAHGTLKRDHLIYLYGDFFGPIFYHIQKLVMSLPFDKIIAVSNYTKDILVEMGVKEDRIVVILNGVDIVRFKPLSSPKKDEEIIVGYIGSLTHVKGVKYLIQAMRQVIQKLPNVKLLIIGEGELQTDIARLCQELKIEDCVKFIGEINSRNMPEAINSLDVVVLPSLSENMPLVMLEAMACGKVFVGTRVGAIPEVIENYVDGIIVEPKDVDALSDAIISVLSDKTLKEKIERNARRKAEGYSWDVTVSKLEKMFRGMIAND